MNVDKEEEKNNNVDTIENKPEESKPKLSFKERWNINWNKTDQLCPHCGNVTFRQKGLNKQNVKRLFSIRGNINDFITLFILIMILFGAWAYQRDTALCRELLAGESNRVIYTNTNVGNGSFIPIINLSGLIITESIKNEDNESIIKGNYTNG